MTQQDMKRKKLKYLTRINKDTLSENTRPDFVLEYLDIGNVNKGIVNEPIEMVFAGAPSRARRIVKNNDVILGTVRTYLQSVGHFKNPDENLIVSTGFAVLSAQEEINSKYLYYHLLSEDFTHKLVAHSTGVSYPAITPKNLSDLEIFYPLKPEQQKIADYLDEKVSKIEKIVFKKRRQTELLKEKRAATIARAVTRGLDPDAELVESGVEWIGQMPKGWEVRKLNHSASRITSGGTPNRGNENFYNGDIPWVVTGELRDGYINETKNLITKTGLVNSSAKMFKKGTVLIALYGATIGKLGILNINASTNQACCAIEPQGSKLSPKFLFYTLLSARQYLISLAYGGGQPNISQSTIKELRIPLPRTDEQEKIISYLDEQNRKIDAIMQKIEQSVQLLQEYKTSLISSAVRGRIKII